MKAAFHTLGCKVNQYETEAMKEQFRDAGYEITGEEDPADVYIINTCTVTNLADRKSRQYIRRMKKQCPQAIVAVTGCYAQVKPEEVAALPEVDIVAGTGEKNHLVRYVGEYLQNHSKQTHILEYDALTSYHDKGIITSMDSRTRAYIKIQEGCNRFCSYCLIPFARGQVRSRDPREIILEAQTLIANGFKELVLTGINTALYGTEENFLYPLLPSEQERGMRGIEIIISRLNALEGDFRIRLSSLEPTVVNADYVKRLLAYEKLCPHLHLSIQSGSDQIIAAMNRHYNREEYLDIVRVLKAHDPHYGITTDIICGFPGETDEDFADSVRMVEEAGFLKVHAFKYSKREGTAAYEMKNQVPGEIKNARVTALIEAGERQAEIFLRESIGEVRSVLFEEYAGDEARNAGKPGINIENGDDARPADKRLLCGYAENYVKVYATGSAEDFHCFKKVKLLSIYQDGLKGEILP